MTFKVLAFCFTDDSIISNLGRLKLTKQDQGMESPTKTDTELSSDSDEDKGGPSDPSEKVQEAPVELKGEVLTLQVNTAALVKINCH